MSLLAQLVIAVAIFVGGMASGVKYQLGVQARIDIAAAEVRATDARKQVRTIDKASSEHLTELRTLNKKLGDARAHIATLSSRPCLNADTVRVLNAIGGQPLPATAPESQSSPSATAPGAGLRFATEQDVAGHIAICRSGYAELSSQLNQILDIEDARGVAQ